MSALCDARGGAPTGGDKRVYQAILTRRYLVGKVIPLLAMFSVALCTAMVIIVLSVMGGFLRMVRDSQKKLLGDVAINAPLTGFGHYEEIADEIASLPDTLAVTPVVEAFGLLKLPDDQVDGIQILGIEPASFDAVTGWAGTMFWRPVSDAEARELDIGDYRHPRNDDLPISRETREALLTKMLEEGRSLSHTETLPDGSTRTSPAAVVGIEISPYNHRQRMNTYTVSYTDMWLPLNEVTISVIPISEGGSVLDAESRRLHVANEFTAGRYDADSNFVFVPFDLLQKMLKLHPKMRITDRPQLDSDGMPVHDEFGNPVMQTEPVSGRATRMLIKGKPGVEPAALRDAVKSIYARYRQQFPDDLPPMSDNRVLTWNEQIREFIAQVEKETALVTTLFSIISLVSVFLVLAIFWTIVQQKTRDVGILRAVGASRPGIAWLFLRYAAILGVVGALIGGAIAWLIVTNINPIHEFIGAKTGTYIWDPKAYYFNTLPNTIDPIQACVIMGSGVVFAVIGGLIPALRAAFIDPVKALRFE